MVEKTSEYSANLSHLALSGWPFQTTPDETFAQIWADRNGVREEVQKLIFRWTRVDRSTLHLLWADLGAGKTHTLKYICRYLEKHRDLCILPVYSVMPKQMKSFLDVYRVVMSGFDLDAFADMFASVYRRPGGRKAANEEVFPYIPDACAALRNVQSDNRREADIAINWLKGTAGLTRRQLEPLGINRLIKTTDDAVAILSGFIRIVQLTGTYRRVVVMLDECQRIGGSKLSIGRDINTGIQTWYDCNPNRLTLMLSFGSGEERFVRHLLSPELLSREDHQHLSMPLLAMAEAKKFIEDLLKCFRVPGSSPSAWHPFSEQQVDTIVSCVTNNGQARVTPRALMKACDAVLSEVDYQIATTGKSDLAIDDLATIVNKALQTLTHNAEDSL